MKATLDYIRRKFEEYNDLCFEGSLKPVPIRLTRARTFLGQIAYKRKKRLFGSWHYDDFVFKISTMADLPEEEMEDIILHEMIHYYILSNQIHDTAPHGKVFRRLMEDINKRFDRHITVSHRKTKEEQENDTQIRQHLICVVKFKSGRTGITIAMRSKLFVLWDGMQKVPDIAEFQWYFSKDPYFNRFPRSKTLKVYYTDPEELAAHLSHAQALERVGNVLRR